MSEELDLDGLDGAEETSVPLPRTHLANGHFAPGNRVGIGNPFGPRINQLRAQMYKAVTDEDMRKVLKALLNKAQKGDLAAISLFLDRLIGRVKAEGLEDRLGGGLRIGVEMSDEELLLVVRQSRPSVEADDCVLDVE